MAKKRAKKEDEEPCRPEVEVADIGPAPVFVTPREVILPPLVGDERALDPAVYGPAALQFLQRVAFSDMGEYLTWGPRGVSLKDSEELTPEQRMLVSSIEEDANGNIKFKLCSKDQAIKLLGQASGVLKEHTELSGKLDVGLLDVLRAIDGRNRGLAPIAQALEPPKTNGANGHG